MVGSLVENIYIDTYFNYNCGTQALIYDCVCPPQQDSGAIDWGDSEAAPIDIEIVDAGSDCNSCSCLSQAQLLPFFCLLKPRVCLLPGPEGVARGDDALSVLENPQSRNQFIDELMEVSWSSSVDYFLIFFGILVQKQAFR